MGFASSGATAVVFVGVLVAAGVVLPTLQAATERTVDARQDRDDRLLDRRNAEFRIAAVTYDATGGRLRVAANNTGTVSVSVGDVDVLVDGRYRSGAVVAVDGNDSRRLWQPGERLVATVFESSRPERVKLVGEFGLARAREV